MAIPNKNMHYLVRLCLMLAGTILVNIGIQRHADRHCREGRAEHRFRHPKRPVRSFAGAAVFLLRRPAAGQNPCTRRAVCQQCFGRDVERLAQLHHRNRQYRFHHLLHVPHQRAACSRDGRRSAGCCGCSSGSSSRVSTARGRKCPTQTPI